MILNDKEKLQFKKDLTRTAKFLCIVIGILLFLMLIGYSFLHFANNKIAKKINNRKLVECRYVRTIDGDTIVVNNGEDLTVRMIGIDTPESVNPDQSKNTKEGKIASDFTNNYFKEGQKLYLEYDKNKTDKYGRTLAYIWIDKKYDTSSYFMTIDQFMDKNYEAILIRNTYTKLMTIKPNTKYEGLFESIYKYNRFTKGE